MPAKRYLVDLTQGEREQLLDISRRGKSSARKVKRSLILCKADEGPTDQQVAEAVMVGPSTVIRVRQRFVEGGWATPSQLTEGPWSPLAEGPPPPPGQCCLLFRT